MYKILIATFLIGSIFNNSYQYNGSITPAVVLAGGIIKAQNIDIIKKYRRKDCPICEGKGWYISGDGIKKVDCGYCEPDKASSGKNINILIHPIPTKTGTCPSNICRPNNANN